MLRTFAIVKTTDSSNARNPQILGSKKAEEFKYKIIDSNRLVFSSHLDKSKHIIIYNVNGVKIFDEKIYPNENDIFIPIQPSTLYILNIMMENKIYKRKIIRYRK